MDPKEVCSHEWPSTKNVWKVLGELPADTRSKIVRENALNLYGDLK